jgi:hypothetical protein
VSSVNPYQPPLAKNPLFHPARTAAPEKTWPGPLRVLIGSTAVAAVSFNLAMMIAVFALLFAALTLLWVVAGLFRGDPRELARRVLYMLVLVAMAPIGLAVLIVQHRILDVRMAPLVTAIEAHRRQTGHYPTTLDELPLSPPSCNAIGGLGLRPHYFTREGSYSIMCMTFGFNHHSYHPERQRWENWD